VQCESGSKQAGESSSLVCVHALWEPARFCDSLSDSSISAYQEMFRAKNLA